MAERPSRRRSNTLRKVLKKDYVAFLKFANDLLLTKTEIHGFVGMSKVYELTSVSGKRFEAKVDEHYLVGNPCYSVFFRFDCPVLRKQNFHFAGYLDLAKGTFEKHLNHLLAQ